MRHERNFLVDAPASSVSTPYPGWIRSLIYLSAATFGLAFWVGLGLLMFR